MYILLVFTSAILLFYSANAVNNPYCGLGCIYENVYYENDVCISLGKSHSSVCDILTLRDDERQTLVDMFNYKRAVFADEAWIANMFVLRWDVELEFLARERGRFCDNKGMHFTRCVRTKGLYLDYHNEYFYAEKPDDIFTFPDKWDDHSHELSWIYDMIAQGDIYKKAEVTGQYCLPDIETAKLTAPLLYWPDIQYMGCSIFRQKRRMTIQKNCTDVIDPYDIQHLNLTITCFFGSVYSQPRTVGFPAWKIGEACTFCMGQECHYNHLCGDVESLKNGINRWQNHFWMKDVNRYSVK